jgi:REP element-mobilizing transposase RayT
MPRSTREVPGQVVYHVLYRAVERQDALVAKKKAKPIEVLGWCLMPNHWHLVQLPHGYDLARWRRKVERSSSEATAEAIDTSIKRGRPFGGEAWTTRIAGRLNLQKTLRSRGRPRKPVSFT